MYKKLLITNKKELTKFKTEILELFLICYDRELSTLLWDWAYTKNPSGSPIVSLYFYNGKLIAHYAIIPYFLENNKQTKKNMLSMTTMVHPEHQRKGIFLEQAVEVYEKAKQMGFTSVTGYPNNLSFNGFIKLGFACEELNLVKLKGKNLLKLDDWKTYMLDKDKFSISKSFRSWRFSKPELVLTSNGDNIIKKLDDECDILELNNENLSEIIEEKIYNIIIKNDHLISTQVAHLDSVKIYFIIKNLVKDNNLSLSNIKISPMISDHF